MNVTLAEQFRGFCISIGAGVFIGALYDAFRLLRIFWNPPKRQIFFLDIFCMLTCGLFTFLLLLAVSDGSLRLYVLFGEGIGFFFYTFTVGKITERIAKIFLYGIHRFIVNPCRRIFAYLQKKVRNMGSKLILVIKRRQNHQKKA